MSSGITAPRGFRAAGIEAGIKDGAPDLALVVADAPCAARPPTNPPVSSHTSTLWAQPSSWRRR